MMVISYSRAKYKNIMMQKKRIGYALSCWNVSIEKTILSEVCRKYNSMKMKIVKWPGRSERTPDGQPLPKGWKLMCWQDVIHEDFEENFDGRMCDGWKEITSSLQVRKMRKVWNFIIDDEGGKLASTKGMERFTI